MQLFARSALSIALCAVAPFLLAGQVPPYTYLKGKPDVSTAGAYKFKGSTTTVEGICTIDGTKVKAWKPDGSPYPALQKAIETRIATRNPHSGDITRGTKYDIGKKIRYVVLRLDRSAKGEGRVTIEGGGNDLRHGMDDWMSSIPGVKKTPFADYCIVRIVEEPSTKTSRVRLRAFAMPSNPLSLPCRVGAKGKLGSQTYTIDRIGRSDPGPKDLNPAGKLSVWFVRIKRTPGEPSAVNAGPGDAKGDMIQYADPGGNPAIYTTTAGKHPGGLTYTSDLNYQVYNVPSCRTEVTHGTGSDSITAYTRVNPAVMPHLLINSSITVFVDLTGIRLDPKK